MMFSRQQDLWHFIANGGTVYLDDTPIKFIDGVLKAKKNNKWEFCPVAFENPKLFKSNT